MICHWDDVPWRTYEHGELRFARQRLSAPRGGAGATLSRYRIAPGARLMPQHVHVDEEELLYVLGDGLALLAYATRDTGDTCWHPDSQKVLLRGLGVVVRAEPLDPWDGER
jgi:hypothetical protein